MIFTSVPGVHFLLFSSSHTALKCLCMWNFRFLLHANPFLHLYGSPFETFGEALCFVLRAAWRSWIFHFPHEITSCNNTALLPKDIPRQALHTRTHTHTFARSSSPGCADVHIPVQVDYLYISIRMFTFNLPFSAQVLSDVLLPAWLGWRISF